MNVYYVLSDGFPALILINSMFKGRQKLIFSNVQFFKVFLLSPSFPLRQVLFLFLLYKGRKYSFPSESYNSSKDMHGWKQWSFKSCASDSRVHAVRHVLYCLLLVGGSWSPRVLLFPSSAQILKFQSTNSSPS